MSRVYSDTVLPEDSGVSQDLTLGTTGDTVQVTAGASLNTNTVKDAGGNTIFVSDGSGNLSSVNSAFSGSGKPTLITTNTSTNVSSSTFTTGIDSTYRLYIIKWSAVNPTADQSNFLFNASTDGGSNYNVTKTTSYFWTYLYEDGTGEILQYRTANDLAQSTGGQIIQWETGSDTDEAGCGEIYLFNPSSTTYTKHFTITGQWYQRSNGSFTNYIGGYLNTTSAVNALEFKFNSGNFDGVIQLYGL